MTTSLSANMLLAVPLAPLVGAALAGILGTQLGGMFALTGCLPLIRSACITSQGEARPMECVSSREKNWH